MTLSRSLFLALLMIATSFGSVRAQRRWDQRLPPPRDLQFYEPRNRLEELESLVETVLIKGRTYVGTLRVQSGSAPGARNSNSHHPQFYRGSRCLIHFI